MITKILLILAVVVAVFLVFVAFQPDDFRVSRSAPIAAPPAEIFAKVNDFHQWEAWSPWAKLDPAAKNSFSGPPSGVGSVFSWSGNSEVGEGSMTLVESRPDELIRIKLDFTRPMKASNDVEFVFTPGRTHTRVTWTMTGKNNFVGKAVGLVMNCDKMVGGMFEKGLANLKAVSEGKPQE